MRSPDQMFIQSSVQSAAFHLPLFILFFQIESAQCIKNQSLIRDTTLYVHSRFLCIREGGLEYWREPNYPLESTGVDPVHLVPMFLYWHMRRFLKVFLKVALHNA